MKTRINTQIGFTLVELMITMTIAIILLTIGVPSLTNMYQQTRADKGLEQLEQAIILARSQAVSYQSIVSICPLSSIDMTCGNNWSNGYQVFSDNSDATRPDKVLKRVTDIPSDDFLSGSIAKISFDTKGHFVSANAVTFSYCPSSVDSSNTKSLSVDNRGNINPSSQVACDSN
ncbi:GspH/FimT family pseudopilin [Shewanella sp. NIFS-20-20]|uniref:GspH/FimT family pseudopilin n=1 Tax=Shewanella sp. NIFS-20-20 TaxID=2853806 RepID=UPI001C444D13|nr:GspH/FimT family pseudopilin [Shewanella sp. NIFS-20-20]MBV7314176.1 GspH/FimT family pseudopilin [Shewanella sp. NIFS-20-20]